MLFRSLPLVFPEFGMIAAWLFRILIVLLLIRRWYKKIKKQNIQQYFEPSFACMGLYGILIIATIWEKGEIGNGLALLIFIAIFSSWVITLKIGTKACDVIRKYDPQLKLNTEVRSPDDFCEIFSQAENLERNLSFCVDSYRYAVDEMKGKICGIFVLAKFYSSC